jgi:hypothetical protein
VLSLLGSTGIVFPSLGIQRPPQCFWMNADQGGGTGAVFRAFRDQLPSMLQLVRRQLARPTDMTAPALRRRHPGFGPFADQFPLELSQPREHGEDKPPLGPRGVDCRAVARQHLQPRIPAPQGFHEAHKGR